MQFVQKSGAKFWYYFAFYFTGRDRFVFAQIQ